MIADDIRTEERPTVPLFHCLVTVRPFAGRQPIVHGRIEVAQRDPVERLDQGFVVIPESRERATEDPGPFEGVRGMDDLLLADRQTSQILPRVHWPLEHEAQITLERMARPDPVA